MCAPDRSRTLSSHRRGIRADPWATRCIFIRRRKRSLRLRIFPARYVLSRPFIFCNFTGFRVYHSRSRRQVSNLSDESIVRATSIRSRQVRERRRWLSDDLPVLRVRRDIVEGYVASTKIRGIFSNDTVNAMFRDSCRSVTPKLRDRCCDSASSDTTASIACIASRRIGWNRKEDSRSVGWRSGGAEWRGVALLAGSREPAAAMPDGRRRTDRQECRSRCSVARCICHMVNGFRVARHHR